jgi:hypothetical protein
MRHHSGPNTEKSNFQLELGFFLSTSQASQVVVQDVLYHPTFELCKNIQGLGRYVTRKSCGPVDLSNMQINVAEKQVKGLTEQGIQVGI